MRLTMPKAVFIPTLQADFVWETILNDPPIANRVYLVKHRAGGEPFYAYQDFGYVWYEVLPDANADGTRELGHKLRTFMDLHYAKRAK